MPVSQPQIPLTEGVTATLQPPPSAAAWQGLIISNLSPFALETRAGGESFWIEPFQAYPIPTPSGKQPVTVLPTAIGQIPQGAAAAVLTTWFAPGEPMPKSPSTLVAAALQAAISGLVDVNVQNTPEVIVNSGTLDATITNASLNVTGPVSISAGQSGVNVSTDAPPVVGPTITIPAGQSSVTETLHPPSNATAIGFAFEPLGSLTLNVQVQDALTLVYLEDFTFAAGGSTGRSFTIPLTPGMTQSGIIVTATAGGTVVVDTTVGYTLWYIGTNSIQPVNYPTQPLYVQGPEAQAQDANNSVTFADQIIAGYYAAGVQQGLIKPGYPDVVAMGYQGTGYSVQTVKQAPQLNVVVNTTLAADAADTLIAAVAGQSIRLRRVQLQTSATEQIVLRSVASGGTLFWTGTPGAGVSTPDMDFEGWSLGADTALVLQNTGSGGTTVTGRITADQY